MLIFSVTMTVPGEKVLVVVPSRCVDILSLHVTMTVPGEKVLVTVALRCDLFDGDGAR